MKMLDLMFESLFKQEKMFGKDSVEVAKTCFLIGAVFMDENLPDSAMEYFKRALEIRINFFMPDSREILEVTNAIRVAQEEINKANAE